MYISVRLGKNNWKLCLRLSSGATEYGVQDSSSEWTTSLKDKTSWFQGLIQLLEDTRKLDCSEWQPVLILSWTKTDTGESPCYYNWGWVWPQEGEFMDYCKHCS